jgi:hypothetical protein
VVHVPGSSSSTSYFIFCSIAILVVSLLISEDRSKHEAVIESSIKAHMKLSISGIHNDKSF